MSVFLSLSSSVSTGDPHTLHEKLQGEGRNEPLDPAWQRLWRSLAGGPCCSAVLCPRGPVAREAGAAQAVPCPGQGFAAAPLGQVLPVFSRPWYEGGGLSSGGPRATLGLYPCCLSKQGKCIWDY